MKTHLLFNLLSGLDLVNGRERNYMSKNFQIIVPNKIGLQKKDVGEPVIALKNYLNKFGYLSETEDISKANRMNEAIFDDTLEKALLEYQKFFKLPESGILDENTVKLMAKPRCGVPDKKIGPRRFKKGRGKWEKFDLYYNIENYTPKLTHEEIRSAIASAFALWSEVTPLTFTEDEIYPNIKILFVEGDHGDGNPFDGIGIGNTNTLAHAYYPEPSVYGDLAGDIHFDGSESWSVNLPSSGIDLISVAAHEIGHSLGLDHSEYEGALMYAYHNGQRQLHEDDIQGIQSLYGSRVF